MERTTTVSGQVYEALQREAARSSQPPGALAEQWLKQHLDVERHPDLEWRQGPGGWRVGIKGTAIDAYTVVGYSRAGYSLQEIAEDLLPRLSRQQVRAALQYYAEHPDEVDRALAESGTEVTKARLYRTLGPVAYRRVTGLSEQPGAIRESNAGYDSVVERPDRGA